MTSIVKTLFPLLVNRPILEVRWVLRKLFRLDSMYESINIDDLLESAGVALPDGMHVSVTINNVNSQCQELTISVDQSVKQNDER